MPKNPTRPDHAPAPPAEDWIARTREMLAGLYPQAQWASLVVNLGDGMPYVTIVVIPNASAQPSAVVEG